MSSKIQLHSYYKSPISDWDLLSGALSVHHYRMRLGMRVVDAIRASRALLPYHPSDLSLSESKPAALKLSREMAHATTHMVRQQQRGWFSRSFASLGICR
jgi:hypothetical protein